MRYIIFGEDGNTFQADKITDDDINTSFSGVIEIIDTKTMTLLCDDMSWKPIQEWK
jgi:acetylglutamate kinase